ncbi:hypothetical protein [Shewanella saliphila]|uniref:Uncharacterized protein n=1 Tax=Shewanella saliphila TaxID=2282698 RepID=A0ABQ2Q5C7_9GAMM|nr:hypothetical protein [Shewanella saliphila]MCL1101867.1 hypothetical protein [Shewanella saliphila]GGP52274.1 hypothetical protein GCM10009409_18350 [Shewanella saliphila]
MFDDSYTQVIEETINGFDVYIEPNPDQYRGGFVWSVSKEDAELDSELAFSINDAFIEMYRFTNTS